MPDNPWQDSFFGPDGRDSLVHPTGGPPGDFRPSDRALGRRSFLKSAGLVAGGAALGATGVAAWARSDRPPAAVDGAHRSTLAGSGLDSPRVFSEVQTQENVVALTFDDGPSPITNTLLELLDRLNVRATFNIIGSRVLTQTDVVRRMSKHDIGNHTWTHRSLAGLNAAEVDSELRQTDELIERITRRRPRYVRPPGGDVTPELLASASQFGYGVLLWSMQLHSPTNPSLDPVSYVVDNVRPGSIIMAHDAESDVENKFPLLSVLQPIITAVRARGFELVTVSELLSAGNPMQGDVL